MPMEVPCSVLNQMGKEQQKTNPENKLLSGSASLGFLFELWPENLFALVLHT